MPSSGTIRRGHMPARIEVEICRKHTQSSHAAPATNKKSQGNQNRNPWDLEFGMWELNPLLPIPPLLHPLLPLFHLGFAVGLDLLGLRLLLGREQSIDIGMDSGLHQRQLGFGRGQCV